MHFGALPVSVPTVRTLFAVLATLTLFVLAFMLPTISRRFSNVNSEMEETGSRYLTPEDKSRYPFTVYSLPFTVRHIE